MRMKEQDLINMSPFVPLELRVHRKKNTFPPFWGDIVKSLVLAFSQPNPHSAIWLHGLMLACRYATCTGTGVIQRTLEADQECRHKTPQLHRKKRETLIHLEVYSVRTNAWFLMHHLAANHRGAFKIIWLSWERLTASALSSVDEESNPIFCCFSVICFSTYLILV